ncbi:MAG: hypothetical protein WDN24_15310 [Sphingomonas sp.]
MLLAGSGHGGAEALVLREYHPDTGVFETRYDVFGDARVLVDELGTPEVRRLRRDGPPRRAQPPRLAARRPLCL